MASGKKQFEFALFTGGSGERENHLMYTLGVAG